MRYLLIMHRLVSTNVTKETPVTQLTATAAATTGATAAVTTATAAVTGATAAVTRATVVHRATTVYRSVIILILNYPLFPN